MELIYCRMNDTIEKTLFGRFTSMARNPYTPGAGTKPLFLAGREKELQDIEDTILDLLDGIPQQSVIYYGLRGVGKTVLLNEIQRITDEKEILNDFFEISEDADFRYKLALSIQKFILRLSNKELIKHKMHRLLSVFKSFVLTWQPDDGSFQLAMNQDIQPEIGMADGHNLSSDLTDLFVILGEYAQMANTPVCFFIDEIQNMKLEELEAIISAIHRTNQKGYPIVVIGAGLPKIAKMAGDIKSYSERLFRFTQIGTLSPEAAIDALTQPAYKRGVTYTPEAIGLIMKETEGYPYFIQEFGKQTWSIKDCDEIDETIAKQATDLFLNNLDDSFFKVRFDRATTMEQNFMLAMAKCYQSHCTVSEVAQIMGKETSSIGPYRAQLINKGLIYSTRHGEIDFTVPHFDKFLRRNKPAYFED